MEMLDLVDNNDKVIGQEERNVALKNGRKNIRVINIFVFNSENKIIVPLRSSNRRIFPNCYDFSVGGFVTSGDSYEATAYKELEEELGIKDVVLQELGYFHPDELGTACFSKLYKLKCDGELDYDKNGISEIFYYTIDEIKEIIEKDPTKFKGDYIPLFNWMCKEMKDEISLW